MGHKLLLVDDEPHFVLSLEFLMQQAGFQVSAVDGGEAALEALGRDKPDLVLLDVMLPGEDGFSICEAIRARAEWGDVKIVMFTARGRQVEREKALALGADAFIVKPFAAQEVMGTISRLLAPGV